MKINYCARISKPNRQRSKHIMKLKKSELFGTLVLIDGSTIDTKEHIGLLSEKISLGLKRRLTKIHASIVVRFNEYQKDKSEAEKSEDVEKEIKELNDEEVDIDCEPVSLQMIEQIETQRNYNWSLIEKIAQ